MRQILTGKFVLLAAMSVAATGIAQDNHPGDPPKEIDGVPFRKYVNSHAYFDEMAKDTMVYEARIGACAKPEKVERLNVGRPQVLTKFPRLGTPPQWMEVLKVTGCDEPVERAVLVVYVNEKTVFLPLVAGNALSRFDVILQKDVINTLIPVERALGVRAGCARDDSVRILDTKTVSTKETEAGLAWEEEWQLATCKGTKRVRISYSWGEGRGTNFQIRQEKAE